MQTSAEGIDIEIPDAPLAYIVLLWRRKMHVGWFEAMRMPLSVIMNDLEMLDIEADVRRQHIARQTPKDMA
ncbi:MAG TPA: hypothetical protein VNG51_19480 [Ktedonobacteraceae bacterium]|nr:hypothetical protein [Ktedonobacteraceae bacterium]